MIELNSITRYERLAIGSLAAVLFVSLIGGTLFFFLYSYDSYTFRRFSQYLFEDGVMVSYLWTYAGVQVLAMVCFGFWVNKISGNLHESGIKGLHYSPTMATMWMLLPGANLVVSFPVMRELYQGSKALGGEVEQWYWPRAKFGKVNLWFAFWIARIAFFLFLFVIAKSKSSDLILGSLLFYFAIEVLCGFFAIQMVRDISKCHHNPIPEWADWEKPPFEVVQAMPHIYGKKNAPIPEFVANAYKQQPTGAALPPEPTDWPGKAAGMPMPHSWSHSWHQKGPQGLPSGSLLPEEENPYAPPSSDK